jgi:hypothetical protein
MRKAGTIQESTMVRKSKAKKWHFFFQHSLVACMRSQNPNTFLLSTPGLFGVASTVRHEVAAKVFGF